MHPTTNLAVPTVAIFAASAANAKEFRSSDVYGPMFPLGQPRLFLGGEFQERLVLAAPAAGRSYILLG